MFVCVSVPLYIYIYVYESKSPVQHDLEDPSMSHLEPKPYKPYSLQCSSAGAQRGAGKRRAVVLLGVGGRGGGGGVGGM